MLVRFGVSLDRAKHRDDLRKGNFMARNIGALDRALRTIIGIVLIAYAIPLGFPHTGWNWVGWIGVVALLTALIGSCPLYSLIGVSTGSRP